MTFLIAMLPVIELRGAIPFGVSQGLNIWLSYAISFSACVLVCIILLAFLVPVFNLMQRIKVFNRFVVYFEEKFQTKATTLNGRAMLGLFIFATLPLPLTGVWTASGIAVFVGVPYMRALVPIVLGTALSGLIIVLITTLFGEHAAYVFHTFLVLALVVLAVICVIALRPKTRTHQ